MKKFLSTGIALTLVLTMLAGCGSIASSGAPANEPVGSAATEGSAESGYPAAIDMEEEPYTVAIQVVTLPGSQFEGLAEREAAINAVTLPAINCQVQIQEVWISEIANTTSMAVAGDEKIDLVHVATVNPLSGLVGSDILLDMNADNLLQNRGEELTSLFGDLMEAGFVNGQQLAVPARVFTASSKRFLSG